eukprot:CAMPEP_0170276426 /NCGR_PEP_ID=MMETSP0116_2-20130129/38197_1 /TAXON_ID=400756 /ORGANISM="Durinskia baltica, Strain CSIRO CS-38" /LENGTH=73 /DNA_ID=CAMNT_0010527697 /DNA_START=152 /DNA_END=373 /DNA_ORIENTATION=+
MRGGTAGGGGPAGWGASGGGVLRGLPGSVSLLDVFGPAVSWGALPALRFRFIRENFGETEGSCGFVRLGRGEV